MTTRIVGIGEPMAGDDGVGIEVIAALRQRAAPGDAELHALRDPSELAALMNGAERLLVIDAVLDADHAGAVEITKAADWLELGASKPRQSLSSHGVDTLTALELGRILAPAEDREIALLTIAIEPPCRFSSELSASAREAIPLAVTRAIAWLEEVSHA